MISSITEDHIIAIWRDYSTSDNVKLDANGYPKNDVDDLRREAINDIGRLISDFQTDRLTIREFKTALDGYNKKKNYWGFAATKGQMFFNLLFNTCDSVDSLASLLKSTIKEPLNLEDAKSKLEEFEQFVLKLQEKGIDKRRLPNPRSTTYFLSYFWQIHNPEKWPIHYSSLVNSFCDLGIWQEFSSQKDEYEFFFNLNEEVKSLLEKHTKLHLINWDVEHAFWKYSGNPMAVQRPSVQTTTVQRATEVVQVKANLNVSDYLVPRVAKLVELGAAKEKTKGSEFEKMVSDVFTMLDFEVEHLGQGTGRNPDAIAKFREDHTAFVIDAKAYSEGYSLGSDDRAIREYIQYFCPKLYKEGLRKIGFIIVSNSFKSGLEDFINEITWTTDVRRFILLTSEALLYLLAYRMKDRLPTTSIIDFLIGTPTPITVKEVIAEFDDV